VHENYSVSPRLELKTYVRAFAQRRLEKDNAELVEPVPACLDQVLDFEFGVRPIAELGDASRFTINRLNMVGPSAYRPFNLHLCGGVESFAIFFRPLAFWQLFRLPLGSLVNQDFDGHAVLGAEANQLWNRLAETATFAERVKVAETYLLRKALNAERNTSIMNAALYMFRARGAVRLHDVASQLSLGLRQFERNFLSEIGLSPKLYSRVARFQAALDTRIHRQDIRWANLANEFGYHDQMHMIKDFQKLSGLTPEGLLSRIGDMRPPALTDAVGESQSSTRVRPGQ
jgi:methylphosphotriester-DNA--protein-cysteine methyltransferase